MVENVQTYMLRRKRLGYDPALQFSCSVTNLRMHKIMNRGSGKKQGDEERGVSRPAMLDSTSGSSLRMGFKILRCLHP